VHDVLFGGRAICLESAKVTGTLGLPFSWRMNRLPRHGSKLSFWLRTKPSFATWRAKFCVQLDMEWWQRQMQLKP
jgi:hypothetical protein